MYYGVVEELEWYFRSKHGRDLTDKDPREDFDPAVDRYLNAAAFTAPGQFVLGT